MDRYEIDNMANHLLFDKYEIKISTLMVMSLNYLVTTSRHSADLHITFPGSMAMGFLELLERARKKTTGVRVPIYIRDRWWTKWIAHRIALFNDVYVFFVGITWINLTGKQHERVKF